MRRDMRNRNNKGDVLNEKVIKYAIIGVSILTIIILGLLIYSKNLNDKVKDGTLSSEQIASILNNTNSQESKEAESTSTEIGKSVNEAQNQLSENNSIKKENTTANKNNTTSSNVLSTNKITKNSNTENQTNTSTTNANSASNTGENKTELTVELSFAKPVEGEIVRDFAVDSLIFSETLQEWTTHTGIDIKADKTTVVKSAEKGTVKSIKNDPRYGLTVVVEHENGFKTVYSNLLTSEFVVEGEKIEKGQSIGTVGNTAAFEIADEPHLHFEMIKDSTQVDPNIYIK
ncbi:metalloendopeptidase-like membrane protein [Clostridium sp. CAG:575]|nr:metalloendopeptidase-like membrane protein [Clostridium sp. CAG:575]